MEKDAVRSILTENILPFWMEKMTDRKEGGFYGRISGEDELFPHAEKGAILNARILWTFSAAYRVTGEKKYLLTATRAKRYIIDFFYDKEYGGVYWSLDYKGKPLDTKKQFYAIGFAIYGLSEYYRATEDAEALDYAIRLYKSIEEHSFDPVDGGYFEACTREWKEISDMRLSDKDANEKKTMNTHLHIIEPYTNLYRVWKDDVLRSKIIALTRLFLDRIEDPITHHLGLFFDEKWNVRGNGKSYGHDIEASWLLLEAAQVIGDDTLYNEVLERTGAILTAAMEGYGDDGGMIYEVHSDGTGSHDSHGTADTDRHWWVQAETVVGLCYDAKYRGHSDSLKLAEKTLSFIQTRLMDTVNGEWHWSVRADGSINVTDDKAGFWKCPYHNGRMCLEILSL